MWYPLKVVSTMWRDAAAKRRKLREDLALSETVKKIALNDLRRTVREHTEAVRCASDDIDRVMADTLEFVRGGRNAKTPAE